MPCTYSVIDIKEREREQERERERQAELARRREERKKAEIARKKQALIVALTSLGFEPEISSLPNNQTLILGKKE